MIEEPKIFPDVPDLEPRSLCNLVQSPEDSIYISEKILMEQYKLNIIMSRKIFLDAFFNQFTSFLKELGNMYPDDPDFPGFVSTIGLIRNTNPMLAVNFIKTEIIDIYGDKISQRDEDFFMNEQYSERQDVDLNIIGKLKEYITSMTPESKEVVWQYVELLMKLALKILESV